MSLIQGNGTSMPNTDLNKQTELESIVTYVAASFVLLAMVILVCIILYVYRTEPKTQYAVTTTGPSLQPSHSPSISLSTSGVLHGKFVHAPPVNVYNINI